MSTAHRPNILLVIFDSLSATAVDQHADKLPTLSALQKTSTRFTRAYVCSPESSPARASLFTGLDIAAHGVWTDGVTLPKRDTTIPEIFASNGYTTWLVGRRQLAGVANWTTEHARPYEYHHFDWAHGPLHRSRQNQYLTWLQETAPDIYFAIFPKQPNADDTQIPATQRQAMADLPDDLSFSAWIAKQACARMRDPTDTGPFLGVIGFCTGKSMGANPTPAACTDPLNDRALEQADRALATVLAAAPKDTVVIATAGRGSIAPQASPMQDPAIKVPLFIHLPNQVERFVDAPVSTTDIAATLYQIAKLAPPKRIQGTCLLTTPARGWALSRLRNPEMAHQTALCTDRWKLVMCHEHDRVPYHLYDLQSDPNETHDLAQNPDHSDTLEDMIDLMIDARVAFEDRTEPRIATF